MPFFAQQKAGGGFKPSFVARIKRCQDLLDLPYRQAFTAACLRTDACAPLCHGRILGIGVGLVSRCGLARLVLLPLQ